MLTLIRLLPRVAAHVPLHLLLLYCFVVALGALEGLLVGVFVLDVPPQLCRSGETGATEGTAVRSQLNALSHRSHSYCEWKSVKWDLT